MDMLFVHKEVWQGVGVVFTLCLFTFNLDPSANVSKQVPVVVLDFAASFFVSVSLNSP